MRTPLLSALYVATFTFHTQERSETIRPDAPLALLTVGLASEAALHGFRKPMLTCPRAAHYSGAPE